MFRFFITHAKASLSSLCLIWWLYLCSLLIFVCQLDFLENIMNNVKAGVNKLIGFNEDRFTFWMPWNEMITSGQSGANIWNQMYSMPILSTENMGADMAKWLGQPFRKMVPFCRWSHFWSSVKQYLLANFSKIVLVSLLLILLFSQTMPQDYYFDSLFFHVLFIAIPRIS